MNDTARGERLQIMLTQEEVVALDNWRFARRMPSRAAAVRELLKRGLANEAISDPEKRTRSQDFGVIGAGEEKPEAEAPGSPAQEGSGAKHPGLSGHGR